MLKDARAVEKLAERRLDKANKQVAALAAKAQATNDLEEKLSLVTKQLEIKKAMLPVVRQREQIRETITNLRIKLRQASQTYRRTPRVVTQGRTLTQGKGRGPVFTQGKGEGPVLTQGKGRGPVFTQGKGEGPVLTQGKGRGPVFTQGKGQGPVLTQGKGEGAVLTQGKGQGPVLTQGKGEGPVLTQGKGKGPVLTQGKGRGPVFTQGKGQGPVLTQGKGQGPVFTQGKGQGPVLTQGKGQGPVLTQGKGKGPVLTQGKGKGPVLTQGKGRGPVFTQGKGQGPVLTQGRGQGPVLTQGRGQGPVFTQGKGQGPVLTQGKGEGAVLTQGKGQGPVLTQGKGQGPVLTQGKGKGPVLTQGKGEGAVFTQGKGEGPVSTQGKGEGSVLTQGKGKGPVLTQGKGEGPDFTQGAALGSNRYRDRPSISLPQIHPTTTTKPTSREDLTERDKLWQLYGHDQQTIQSIVNDADYASLASAAYNPSEKLEIEGWSRIETIPYTNKNTGSNAASIYESKTGEIVVAFQGTSEDGFWSKTREWAFTNLGPFYGFESGQTDWAKGIARKAANDYPGRKLTFVGHSMGGRLARIARTETGADAVTFDSAPASGNENVAMLEANPAGTWRAYRAPGDVPSLLTALPTTEIKNYDKSRANGSTHSIAELARAMQEMKNYGLTK